jgi:hypothetical protein
MSLDPRFERWVLAEFALRQRQARRSDPFHGARALAESLHETDHDLLVHVQRVAVAVPRRFRAVAWLHHAGEAGVTPSALTAAGLTVEEATAIALLAQADPPLPNESVLSRCRALSNAPGLAGHLARVVARAALEDRLDGAEPQGEILTALRLLPSPAHNRFPLVGAPSTGSPQRPRGEDRK